ncbi:hypothetical protein B0H13DRAFT_2292261 [Mycena leptocephala]|nr:hypothetical protein B0H13DRAFT_2292261 [Mycena leptocephala]
MNESSAPNTCRMTSTPSTARSGLPRAGHGRRRAERLGALPRERCGGNNFTAGRCTHVLVHPDAEALQVKQAVSPSQRRRQNVQEVCSINGWLRLTSRRVRFRNAPTTEANDSGVTRVWTGGRRASVGGDQHARGEEDFAQLGSAHLRVPLERPPTNELTRRRRFAQIPQGVEATGYVRLQPADSNCCPPPPLRITRPQYSLSSSRSSSFVVVVEWVTERLQGEGLASEPQSSRRRRGYGVEFKPARR